MELPLEDLFPRLGDDTESDPTQDERRRSKRDSVDPYFTPVSILAERIREGRNSPVDIVQAFLDRIREHDVNAFVTEMPDRALEAAHDAKRAVERGDELGPLHGASFAVKSR